MSLEKKCKELKKQMLGMCIKAGTGHVSSCLSCAEIMVTLYYKVMQKHDKFLLSKGHASPLLYAILADKGYFPEEELETFCQPGSRLGVHLNDEVPGVEAISGSLGYGLGIGAGMALAKKNIMVYVLLGDSECQEGSIWEAAMFIGREKMLNMVAIIDINGYGATPSNRPTCNWDWDGFGWQHSEVDGHDMEALAQALTQPHDKPLLIKAKTIKGHGISFLTDAPPLHGAAPKGDEIEIARRELNA